MLRRLLVIIPLTLFPLQARQDKNPPDSLLQQVLHRLDALEQENRELLTEVHELKRRLPPVEGEAQAEPKPDPDKSSQAPLQERVAVNELSRGEAAADSAAG